jgi:hypothetical protein
MIRRPLRRLRASSLCPAVAATIEQLESRRLLCTLGTADGDLADPIHLYDPEGHHLDLNLPDAGLIDIPASAKSATLSYDQMLAMAATPAPTGSLSGKVVYLNGGHGWTWGGSSWATQRGNNNSMVEDFGTQDQITYYAQYLLTAGATVVPTRPIGHQTNEVIVDNNDAGFSHPVRFVVHQQRIEHLLEQRQRHRHRPTVTASPTSPRPRPPSRASRRHLRGRLLSRLRLVEQRLQPLDRRDLPHQQRRRSQEVKVNQRYTGKGWVYLGTYYFDSGTARATSRCRTRPPTAPPSSPTRSASATAWATGTATTTPPTRLRQAARGRAVACTGRTARAGTRRRTRSSPRAWPTAANPTTPPPASAPAALGDHT